MNRWSSAGAVILAGVVSLLAATAGCSDLRLSGYKNQPAKAAGQDARQTDGFAVKVSTKPARRRPKEYLPEKPTPQQMNTLYYSDLGPDLVDVSGYPARQRHNYAVYSRACSQCHTLARSINAPTVSRRFWEFYILSMRFHAFFKPGTAMPREDVNAILDFLDYDSKVRKIQHRSEFDELTDELKRRFDPILQERIRRLQEGKQPVILRPDQP